MATERPGPVLLVPGLLCSHRLFAGQMPMLWERGPVMVADHRRCDTMEDLASGILAAAPARFALVGLSMGGYVAFEILRQSPDRVTRLALLDTSAKPDTPAMSEHRMERIALAEGGRFDEIPDLTFAAAVDPSRRADNALRDTIRLMATETGVAAFVRQQRAMTDRPDSRPLLGSIRCPTLVLTGENDRLTPFREAAEIAEGIAASRLVSVPECGHFTTLEKPAAVAEALAAWLDT